VWNFDGTESRLWRTIYKLHQRTDPLAATILAMELFVVPSKSGPYVVETNVHEWSRNCSSYSYAVGLTTAIESV
jgi:hypothetical protein